MFDTLLSNLPGMAYRCRNDPDWTMEFVSEGCRALTGYHPEDLLYNRVVSYAALIHPDDRERVREEIQAAVAERRPFRFVYRLITAGGETRWVWEQGRGVYTPEGALEALEGFITDVTEQQQALEALRASEERFAQIFHASPLIISISREADGVFLEVNEAFERAGGWTRAEAIGRSALELGLWPDPAEREQMRERLRANGGRLSDAEWRFRRRDGVVRDVRGGIERIMLHGEACLLFIGQDVTERKRTEAEMRKLSGAIAQTADIVMITDREGHIEYVNEAFEQITGYTRTEALGRKPNLLKSGLQDDGFYRRLWQTLLAGETFRDVFVNRRKNGELFYEEKTITPLKDDSGAITHFIATGKDITERVRVQERLTHLAYHDALTDLPNRVLFMERLAQALARARWHGRVVAVLFLDLDRFKYINDTMGHEAGDRFLQVMAQRLQGCLRDGDTMARLGGDEFAILLEDIAKAEDVAPLAEKILQAFALPFMFWGREYCLTVSIGISLYPSDAADAATLLRNADIAMYRAKELGRNGYQFYSAEMSALALERITLEADLRRALERGEFELEYQPQVDLGSGVVCGAEVLLRWRHPRHGPLLPHRFVTIAEEAGLIEPIGEWVLRAALEQGRRWREAGWRQRLAINVSGRQLDDDRFVTRVEEELARSGLDPVLLELEITESVVMRPSAAVIERLERLARLGVRMAIDDFGTGYSSLAYLKRFRINTLKIDRSFVQDLATNRDDAEIVRAIIAMGRGLGLRVVAEGVETEAQLAFLREQGCHVAQGYYFGEPLPAAAFERRLSAPFSAWRDGLAGS
jgi:diguanylate cyclase (GGDEF)-like protein/PAS domain S-box-containing protein